MNHHSDYPGAPPTPGDTHPRLWCCSGTERRAKRQGDGLGPSRAGSKGTRRAGKELSSGEKG